MDDGARPTSAVGFGRRSTAGAMSRQYDFAGDDAPGAGGTYRYPVFSDDAQAHGGLHSNHHHHHHDDADALAPMPWRLERESDARIAVDSEAEVRDAGVDVPCARRMGRATKRSRAGVERVRPAQEMTGRM